ncbi:MAG: hypothetical protein OEM59_19325 [Rhodospirillales bacterium]|nr:hypothetical protein [Rhodospirillales bacterium]
MTTLRKATPILAAAAGAALFAAPAAAAAAEQCSEHGKVLGQFAKTYKEAPVAAGLTRDGRLLQVLSSGDDGTWTIVLSKPDGVTCVIMAGEAWRPKKFEPVEAEEPKA